MGILDPKPVTAQSLDAALPARLSDASLAAAYASAELIEPMLLQKSASSKGGVIGVGDKGVVAIRFDDWHAAFKTNVYPLMLARGLPAGYATISRLDQQSWTAGVTTADLVAWNKNGIEFHSHGTDHKDPTPQGRAGLIDQIVNSKAEIEAWGVKCQGWMQPGATPLTAAAPYGQTSTFTDLTNEAGQLVRRTYPLSEMYVGGAYRNLPHGAYHGLDHVTVSDGMTVANAKLTVDTAVAQKIGIELMVHSGNLGGAGNMTIADFTALLDYIVTYREAGKLEVLTPSGLMFADKSSRRLDLITDGSFEGMTTGDAPTAAWNVSWTGGVAIETTGGRTGSKFIRFPSTATNFAIQRPTYLKQRNLSGETFVFEGWAKSNGAGTTVSRVLIQDYDDINRFNLSLTRASIGSTWTKVIHAITIPPLTDRLTFGVGRNSADGIDWDDVKLHKV